MIAAVTIILLIASVYDIKTKTVPLWITPCALSIRLVYLVTNIMQGTQVRGELKECMIAAFILFIVLYIGALVSNLGGADCLMAGIIGFALGLPGILAVAIGFGLALPYTIYMKATDNEHEYAFVPYLFAGFLIAIAFIYNTGGSVGWLF